MLLTDLIFAQLLAINI